MYAKDIRRENLRALAKQLGGITQLAEKLGKSQSQISQLIGKSPSKNIGDKIATQVENLFNKPHGWMDTLHNHIDETTTAYELFRKSAPHRPIPLIRWNTVEINQPLNSLAKITTFERLIPGGATLGEHAFALQLSDLNTDTLIHYNFPSTTVIVVDPDFNPCDNAYIVQRENPNNQLVIRQLKAEGQRFYLKPIAEQLPLEPLSAPGSFGVIRQILIDFE